MAYKGVKLTEEELQQVRRASLAVGDKEIIRRAGVSILTLHRAMAGAAIHALSKRAILDAIAS